MSKKVIVTARSFGMTDDLAEKLLEGHGFEVKRLPRNGESLQDGLSRELPDADAVIAGLEEYNAEIIGSAKALKVISRYGVGYDKVDCSAARIAGIPVTITPGANGDSVADLAVTLMLSVARNIPYMDRTLKEGDSKRPSGLEMVGKTVGIVGAGRIGKGVAKRCKGFDMNVLLYDAYYQDQEFASSIEARFTDLETIVREADFITIHANLNDSTRNMFGKKQFEMMKDTAVIVNTARGGIIDEDALYDALKEGQIYGAGLDVSVTEPASDSRLCTLPNCILTPHAGAATREAVSRMSLVAAQNVIDVIETGTSVNIVPECR